MRNVHISLTNFLNESRVLKEVSSLLDHQIVREVIVLALWKPGLRKKEKLASNINVIRIYPYSVYVIRKIFGLNEIAFIKALNIYLGVYLIFLRPDIVNLHHVNLLGIVNFKRIITKCKFVYDTHELETETQSSVGDLKSFRRNLEKKFIPLVDYVFVVTPSIESWYRTEYSVDKITTVMNTPRKYSNVTKRDFFRSEFEINKRDTIFIYNGSLFKGRGIEILLEVFEKIENKAIHIVFMGDGEFEKIILEYAGRNKNIHFKAAVEPDKVIEYTSSADVGISLIERACLSYYYCLPNKIFEYTMAEIPMLVSNMKDMSEYVAKNKIGEVAKSFSKTSIMEAVNNISEKKNSFQQALLVAKELYNWENEEIKLISAYKSILSNATIN